MRSPGRLIPIIGPRRAAASLACGVLLTIAVAWWFALALRSLGHSASIWYPHDESIVTMGWREEAGTVENWILTRDSPGRGTVEFTVWHRGGTIGADPPSVPTGACDAHRDRLLARFTDRSVDYWRISTEFFGWPFDALRFTDYTQFRKSPQFASGTRSGGWTIRRPGPTQTMLTLPLIPRPGFLLNTLVFAVPAYALLSAPVAARLVHRRMANRCRACGYSLDGLAADECPECGTPRSRNASRTER